MASPDSASRFSSETFAFLEELEINNTREWFSARRDIYESRLRQPFIELLEEVTVRLADSGEPLSGGDRTVFRVNRDVRFSADKTPYNTHISGVLTPSGTKSETRGLVYLHLDAAGGFLAAGLYRPPVPRLATVRNAIIDKPGIFSEVLSSLDHHGLSLDRSESTSAMPRGFTQYAEHPHAETIRLKNMMVTVALSPDDWIGDGIASRVESFARNASPLLRFLDKN